MAGTAGEAGKSPPPAQGLLRAKVVQGGTYLFFRQFISLGLSLLGLFIVSRLIGPEGRRLCSGSRNLLLFTQPLADRRGGVSRPPAQRERA